MTAAEIARRVAAHNRHLPRPVVRLADRRVFPSVTAAAVAEGRVRGTILWRIARQPDRWAFAGGGRDLEHRPAGAVHPGSLQVTGPVRVPAWLEPHRDLVARRRSERATLAAVAAELGVSRNSLSVYLSTWRREGDARFAPLSTRELSLRRRGGGLAPPSCRWTRRAQVAAFLRAGHGARTVAAAAGLRTQYVHELASRLRAAGLPDPRGVADGRWMGRAIPVRSGDVVFPSLTSAARHLEFSVATVRRLAATPGSGVELVRPAAAARDGRDRR